MLECLSFPSRRGGDSVYVEPRLIRFGSVVVVVSLLEFGRKVEVG